MGKGSKVDWSTPSRSRFRYSMKGVAEGGLTARDGSSVQRVHHIVAKESTPLVPGNHTRVPALSFHYEKVADGDVERRVYDADFAARMKAYRLARARRVSDWAEQWLALEGEYLTRSRRARSLLGDLVTSVALQDGHVAEVVLTARALLERGAELLIRAPRVRHLHVTGYAEVGPSLFSCASLRGMQSLGLRAEGLGDEDVDALAASPFVDGLRWLDLAHNCLGQRALETLASCFTLSRLEYLGFEGNAVESPVDHFGTDALDGAVVDTNTTATGRALERLAGRTLSWLHAPEHFPYDYPPSPVDVAMCV